MSGVKGKSGRRIASPATLDKLISHARMVSLRAIQSEEIPLLDRARLATQFPLKEMADKSEAVVLNLNISDELMLRMLDVMKASRKVIEPPPLDAIIIPTLEPNDPVPNELPNDPC